MKESLQEATQRALIEGFKKSNKVVKVEGRKLESDTPTKEYAGIKYFNNVEDKCPICNSRVYYEARQVAGNDGMVYYPWMCDKCLTRGEAWYKETFEGHTIITQGSDEEIELPLDEGKKVEAKKVDTSNGVPDEFYEIANIILNKVGNKNFMSKDDFEDLLFKGAQKVLDIKTYDEMIDEFPDIDSTIRGILSYNGWATDFNEGDLSTDPERFDEGKKVETTNSDDVQTSLEKAFTEETEYWLQSLADENSNDSVGQKALEVLDDKAKIKEIVDELVNGSDDIWEDIHIKIERLADIDMRNSIRKESKKVTEAIDESKVNLYDTVWDQISNYDEEYQVEQGIDKLDDEDVYAIISEILARPDVQDIIREEIESYAGYHK